MAEMKQRKQPHNISVKEVIGSLCRLMTTLGLDSVPNAESFRRAKFNEGDEVVEDFWKLLTDISIISTTNHQTKADVGSLNMLMRETLWLSGWGADLEEAQTEMREVMKEKGSRHLLLALGWLISTNLLERLLKQKTAELDTTLTLSPMLTLSPKLVPKGDGLHTDPALLRKLQWLIGCLKFQGRTLLSLQEERVRLLHQILSWGSFSPQSCFQSSSSNGSTALQKQCTQMERLCELLEVYLNWKHVEKLFWVWMDSVLECQLAAESEKGPVALVPTQTTSHKNNCYLHGNPSDLDLLDIMVKRLPFEQSTEKGEVMRQEKVLLMKERKLKEKDIERNICMRLRGLTVPSALAPFSYGCRTKFKRQMPHQHTNCLTSGVCVRPGEVHCSSASNLLKERELWLLHEQTLNRLANKNALQDLTGRQNGLVLIPP